jgi:hypothetical protein
MKRRAPTAPPKSYLLDAFKPGRGSRGLPPRAKAASRTDWHHCLLCALSVKKGLQPKFTHAAKVCPYTRDHGRTADLQPYYEEACTSLGGPEAHQQMAARVTEYVEYDVQLARIGLGGQSIEQSMNTSGSRKVAKKELVDMAGEAAAEAIAANCRAIRLFQTQEGKKMWLAITRLPPGTNPPDEHTISDVYLPRVVEKRRAKNDILLRDASTVVIVVDCYTKDKFDTGTMAFHAILNGGESSILVHQEELHDKEDADFAHRKMREVMMNVIRKKMDLEEEERRRQEKERREKERREKERGEGEGAALPLPPAHVFTEKEVKERVDEVVLGYGTDNHIVMIGGNARLQLEFPNLFFFPCVVHSFDLGLQDAASVAGVKEIATRARHLVQAVRGRTMWSRFRHIVAADASEVGLVLGSVRTRFGTEFDSWDSLFENKLRLETLYGQQLSEKAAADRAAENRAKSKRRTKSKPPKGKGKAKSDVVESGEDTDDEDEEDSATKEHRRAKHIGMRVSLFGVDLMVRF